MKNRSIAMFMSLFAVLFLFSCSGPNLQYPAELKTPENSATGMALLQLNSAAGSPFSHIAVSATVTISAPDMITLTKQLIITDSTVEGTVSGIPSGKDRRFELAVYDSLDIIQYRGTAISDVIADSAVSILVRVSRVAGSSIIKGYIDEVSSLFTIDKYTLALFRFDELSGDTLFDETGRFNGQLKTATRVGGVLGNAIAVTSGSYASFDTIIPSGLSQGTVEFYFKKGSSFSDTVPYALFGNDGARFLLAYKGGHLHFLKNHSDSFHVVSSPLTFSDETWYHIAATWGTSGMSLFVNDSLRARNTDYSDYRQSIRTVLENSLFIGHKMTGCCVADVGITVPLHLEGIVDELRISNVERY